MKFISPTLALLSFFFGVLFCLGSLQFDLGMYIPLVTISALVGFIFLLIDRKKGSVIMILISCAWLLHFFERATYLIIYDAFATGRWILVLIPISLSTASAIIGYKEFQQISGRTVNLKALAFLIVGIASIASLSWARKTHIKEFNCWYYFDKNEGQYKITFATSPENKFELITESKSLKDFVLRNGIRDEFRKGIYCSETKVKIVTTFNKAMSIEITGFHNTTTNYNANLNEPFKINVHKLNGDLDLLQPDF